MNYNNNMEKIVVNFKEKTVILSLTEFDTDMDMDDILRIDYSNIIGEVLTFPVIVNRIGILRAEQENIVSNKKLKLEVYAAELKALFKKNEMIKVKTAATNGTKLKPPTVNEIENHVLLDKGYQNKRKEYFRAEKDYNYIDSLYWAAKDKSKKLDYCSAGIKPSDFENEIVTGSVNGVMIKVSKNLI